MVASARPDIPPYPPMDRGEETILQDCLVALTQAKGVKNPTVRRRMMQGVAEALSAHYGRIEP